KQLQKASAEADRHLAVVNGKRAWIVEDGVDESSKDDLKTERDGSRFCRATALAHGAKQRRGCGCDRRSRQFLEPGPSIRPRIVVLACGAQHALMVSHPADDSIDQEAAEFPQAGVGQALIPHHL